MDDKPHRFSKPVWFEPKGGLKDQSSYQKNQTYHLNSTVLGFPKSKS